MLPFWETKIFSVWLTTVELTELVLTSLTMLVVEVAFPVLIIEVGADEEEPPKELSFGFCVELSSAEGVALSVAALSVLVTELSPLLAFELLSLFTVASLEISVPSGVGVGVSVGVTVGVSVGSTEGSIVRVGVSVGVPMDLRSVLVCR